MGVGPMAMGEGPVAMGEEPDIIGERPVKMGEGPIIMRAGYCKVGWWILLWGSSNHEMYQHLEGPAEKAFSF